MDPDHQTDDLKDKLIPFIGTRCSVCGGNDLELWYDQTDEDSVDNIRLVCKQCNTIREYDFEYYMLQLLEKNEQFRNIKTTELADGGKRQHFDIIADELVENEWKKIYIELKASSSFTTQRLHAILNIVLSGKSNTGNAKIVFAFPGRLPQQSIAFFKKYGIGIWDLAYISKRFSKEIKTVYHPILQPLFLKGLVSPTPLEKKLINDLKSMKPRKKNCFQYQKLIGKILERLFCPPLESPLSEHSDLSRVNRRDFILPNYVETGFWAFIRSEYLGYYIVADAKNYVGKISKKCALQLSNYLKAKGAGLFGLIVSRNGGAKGCIQTIRDIWIFDKKLIIILTDDDVEKMLIERLSGRNPEIIIRQKIEDFRLTL